MKTLTERLANGVPLQKAIYQLTNSHKKKRQRMNNRIKSILQHEYCYFITYTIKGTPQGVNKYTSDLRHSLNNFNNWVCNADYGSQYSRLHFHAIVGMNEKLDYKGHNLTWWYGTVDYIRIHKKNVGSLSRYILKLINHSLKESANNVMYCSKKSNN